MPNLRHVNTKFGVPYQNHYWIYLTLFLVIAPLLAVVIQKESKGAAQTTSTAEEAATNAVAPTDITSGLVVWLPLNEGAGTSAVDASGNSNNGVLQGGPNWVTGQLGAAVDINNPTVNEQGQGLGTEWIEIQPTFGQNLDTQVTMAAWVRADQLRNGDGVITKGENITSYALRLWGDGSLMFTANFGEPFGWQGAGDWRSNATISTGAWHHIAVTYDGSNLRFYIDGVEDSNAPALDLVFWPGDSAYLHRRGFPR